MLLLVLVHLAALVVAVNKIIISVVLELYSKETLVEMVVVVLVAQEVEVEQELLALMVLAVMAVMSE
jgi:hypothetical protein